ncbi:cytochrome-c peroxidase [Pontibacter cellulosilyticus]|nr:cytochrome c peroxidase [Pontibacter cellulosilyticus]
MISLFALFISCIIVLDSCSQRNRAADTTVAFQEMEELYVSDLSACISALDKLKNSASRNNKDVIRPMREHYQKARMYFKYAELVLSFIDTENFRFLNQPNILKVEEEDQTDIKEKEPSGFQVLEELVYADSVDRAEVAKHAALMSNRLKLIRSNTQLQSYQAYHFLWILRNGIARVALTGITGFDSPVLEASLQESAFAYKRLKRYLSYFKHEFKDEALYQAWNQQLDQSMESLKGDFASFDRYSFIKKHTHPQLELWVKTQQDWEVEFPFTLAFNHGATSLFSDSTFNLKHFDDLKSGDLATEKVLLGKQLFNDPSLSISGTMSCGSCHQENLAFTDGMAKSVGQTRNSPTMSYAGLQRGFFYDKRSGSLEGQIVAVVNNETEFHTSLEAMSKVVKQKPTYQQQFEALYEQGATEVNIRNAIASYIKSLSPFNSKFDRNISGKEQSLTEREIRGFNLFMGKAKCATCHFAPVFNGTVPPEFTETEMELLGVPAAKDTVNAKIDPDLGRYNLFGTESRKHFFKTPTLRNVALTAPYMHNGVYTTLEEVMDFYNRGGGAGIGIQLEHQTLPPDALSLTKQEIKDIIAFLNTLTDQNSKPKQLTSAK